MSISSLERTKVGNFMATPGLFCFSLFFFWICYIIFFWGKFLNDL